MGRVQIVVRRTDGAGRIRWQMVAHGAPYDRASAQEYLDKHGKAAVRLLPLPKGA